MTSWVPQTKESKEIPLCVAVIESFNFEDCISFKGRRKGGVIYSSSSVRTSSTHLCIVCWKKKARIFNEAKEEAHSHWQRRCSDCKDPPGCSNYSSFVVNAIYNAKAQKLQPYLIDPLPAALIWLVPLELEKRATISWELHTPRNVKCSFL